ncbi:hypothetical protein, partial [Pannonibacter sp. P2PFMT1]|uniref:hypothetical protein n=1 Tax=Pannonibacter sp. P2PFMT1 TaxID=2003582 RepID=UPI001AD94ECF
LLSRLEIAQAPHGLEQFPVRQAHRELVSRLEIAQAPHGLEQLPVRQALIGSWCKSHALQQMRGKHDTKGHSHD